MSNRGITVYFTNVEEEALRSYDAEDATTMDWQAVWEACRAALPSRPKVGDYVEPTGATNSYYPAEVILVRGHRVYAIDKDGDSCDFSFDEVEVVA